MPFTEIISVRNNNVEYSLYKHDDTDQLYKVVASLHDKKFGETYIAAEYEFDDAVMFLTLDKLVETLERISDNE